MTSQPILSVRDLAVSFPVKNGDVHAVNGVSFDVHPGEMLGIVGESGCGKSQTMRAILGLTSAPGRVTGGTVEFDGQDLTTLSRQALRTVRGTGIGFVSQSPFGALNPILRLEKQFGNVIRAHRKATRREIRATALASLASVGIVDPERVLDGYAHELSGGMAQRVVIAMAMVHGPRLLLADEPTTALDVTVQRQILDLMESIITQGERSMVLVTHDLGVVAQYCQRVLVMYAGKPVEVGAVADVFVRPEHPYTRALLDAVPRAGAKLSGLRGSLPNLVHYPIGCPYAPRCPGAQDVCRDTPPDLALPARSEHTVSCHHPLNRRERDHATSAR